MGSRGYLAEFRRKVLDLVEAGCSIADVAGDLDINDQSIYTWRRQDRIDRGLVPGLTSTEQAELAAARRRITQLETELAATLRAMELVREVVPPKRRYEAIKLMAAGHFPVDLACRVLDVSVSGHPAGCRGRHRPDRCAMHG